MLGEPVKVLIYEEYARQGADFIAGVDLDAYVAKLDEHAEVVSDFGDGRCRGFVAYYCNDLATKRTYITLVLVDPRDRGHGLATELVGKVLDVAKERGFTSCALEVGHDNTAAQALYRSMGFRVAERRSQRDLLERNL